MKKTLSARLTLEVHYELNGVSPKVLLARLEAVAKNAIFSCGLTDELTAEIVKYAYKAEELK